MRNRLPVLLLGVLLAPLAFAEDRPAFTVEGSNVARFDQGREVDSRLAERDYPRNTAARRFFENRLRLDVYRGNLRLGARLLYFRPSGEDRRGFNLVDTARVDKRYLEATLDPLKIRVGHFSDVWGYGLAFSAFENRDLYFDSELDGARFELSSDPFFLVVLRGSTASGPQVRKSEATAARIQARMFGQAAAFNYVFVDSGAYRETHVASVDGRFSYGPVTLYGERAWYETVFRPVPREGYATYLGSVVSALGWSLLVEYKDYRYRSELLTPFQRPATVYRETGPRLLQAREPHFFNIPDEVGFQLELSGHIREGTFATVHCSHSSKHAKGQRGLPRPTLAERDAPYVEFFASLDQDLADSRTLLLEVGRNEEAAAVWYERKWLWLKFKTPLHGKHEIEIGSETLVIHDKRRDREFTDQAVSLEWSDGGTVSLTVAQEFSTDAEVRRREGRHWPSAEIAFTLGNGKHRFSAFYGRERGGLRCANGICRQVQPFSGLRLSLETSL